MKLKNSTLYRWPSIRWGDDDLIDDGRLPDAILAILFAAYVVNSVIMVYF